MNRRSQLPAEDSPAFGAIAERFRRAGEHEKAVSLCQEGLAKFPEHLSARVTMGWALLDLGRYKEARTELERVIKRAPDNLAAIRGLAELHDRTENADVSDLHGRDWLPVEESAGSEDERFIKIDSEASSEAAEAPVPAFAAVEEAVAEPPYDPALREVAFETTAVPAFEAPVPVPEFALAPDIVTPQDALFFEEDLQSRLPFESAQPVAAVQLAEPEPAQPELVQAALVQAELAQPELPEPFFAAAKVELTAAAEVDPVVVIDADPSFDGELEQFIRAIGPPVAITIEGPLATAVEPEPEPELAPIALEVAFDELVPLSEIVTDEVPVLNSRMDVIELPVIDLPVLEVIETDAAATARPAVLTMAARHEHRATPTPALAALERFLRRVETRKLEGRLASVAS